MAISQQQAAAEPLVVKAHDPHDILMCVICMPRLASRVSLQSGIAAIDKWLLPYLAGQFFCWIVPQQTVLHRPISSSSKNMCSKKGLSAAMHWPCAQAQNRNQPAATSARKAWTVKSNCAAIDPKCDCGKRLYAGSHGWVLDIDSEYAGLTNPTHV